MVFPRTLSFPGSAWERAALQAPPVLRISEPPALATGKASEPPALATGRISEPPALAAGKSCEPTALATGRVGSAINPVRSEASACGSREFAQSPPAEAGDVRRSFGDSVFPGGAWEQVLAVLTVLMLGCTCCFADEPKLHIRLKDGSFGTGRIVSSSEPKRLGWKCEGFENVFEFDINAIRSVTRVMAPNDAQAAESDEPALLVEMTGGSQFAGQLQAMDDEWLTVQSKLLGPVKISRQNALAIIGKNSQSQLVYADISADGGWQALQSPEDWEIQAGSLSTSKKDVAICGHVDLPVKSKINLTIDWTQAPEFVLTLGVKLSGSTSYILNKDVSTKLEVWDNQLVLVREVDGNADIAMLADVAAANSKIDLTILFDQENGIVVVMDPYGKLLGSLTLASESTDVGTSVFLTNLGKSISLERFEVRHWDGVVPTDITASNPGVRDDKGNAILGDITGFDIETQSLIIENFAHEESKLPIDRLRHGQFHKPEKPDESKTLDLDDALVNLQLIDRTRLKGHWQASDSDQLCFAAIGLSEPIRFTAQALREILGTADRYPIEDANQRTGTIKIGNSQFAGYLSPNSPEVSRTGLHWQPYSSLHASEVSGNASGSIEFSKPTPIAVKKRQSTNSRGGAIGPLVQLFNGNKVVAPEGKTSEATAPSDTLEIHFRSGDAIRGKVIRIDERGLTFSSAQTKTDFASHDQIDQVWLNPLRPQAATAPEKRERLLTIPRSMKKDPPTHLFVSVTGDYLRGRLVKLDDAMLTLEVRSELTDLPISQVAQIVWLHDRDWSEQKQDADENGQETPKPVDQKPFQIHTITNGNHALTLQPIKTANGVLEGRSQLLGETSVAVNELSQLLFGRDIEQQVQILRKNPWKLSLAMYPRVYREDGAEGAMPKGENHPLVGKLAPDFTLQTLDGKSFRLSSQRDRIVVLDFWASWCGPCIQTMPLVDEVVNEIGTDKIYLAAVNIEEPASKVRVAVDRMKVTCEILLDQDGQTAAAYGAVAIPQTVIIDRSGNVAHVFVGGGAKFVDEFRQALQVLTSQKQ